MYSKRELTSWAITAFLIGGLLGGLIVWLVMNDRLEEQKRVLETQIEETRDELESAGEGESENNEINTVQNWQTFKNPSPGFTIQYPPDWKLTAGTDKELGIITNFPYSGQSEKELKAGQTKRVLTAENNPGDLSAVEHQQNQSPDDRIVSRVQIKINSIQASIFSLQGAGEYKRVYFPPRAENQPYIVMTVYGDDSVLGEMIKSFHY